MGLFGKKTSVFDSTKMPEGPHTYSANGKEITCPQCQGKQFVQGSALLNTPGMTFLGLDWANKSATVLICAQCSHIQWFLQQPRLVV